MVLVSKCVLIRCSIREEGMSWKGVQGGKPEGEERMRGSALSSPMGVPLDSLFGYQKKRGAFERGSHVSPLALWFSPFKPFSVTHPPLAACSYDKNG